MYTERTEMWTFETARFAVKWFAEPAFDLDLSWDEDGEVASKLANGTYTAFDSTMTVYLDGREIASDHLGASIYENVADFRDHFGSRGKYGSYFSDMVRTACTMAREELRRQRATAPYVRA